MSENNEARPRLPVGIIGLCSACLAILWTSLIFYADQVKDTAVTQARRDASNLAVAFRENVERTLSAIDQLMITIIAENNESGLPHHIPAWVKNAPFLKGISVQVGISDRDGFIVDTTPGISRRFNISDREYFRHHLDAAAYQPYVGVPVIGRTSERWAIQVTRRITDKDGSFAGIIGVSIDPFYLSRFFDEVAVGQNGVITLIGRDGIVRARRALTHQDLGQDVTGSELFNQITNANVGSYLFQSNLDGVSRVYGYAAVCRFRRSRPGIPR